MPDPLALISRAERALAEATDLTELMDLRAIGKGAEAAAVALGLGEVAQRAKVFQVRAERKAGAWLSENIPHNGGGRAQAGRVTLGDLEIDHHASSRWQELAMIPEDKFNGFLDEHIAKGWEVTSGGLRSYARNLSGRPVRSQPGRGIWLVPPPGVCALSGYMMASSIRRMVSSWSYPPDFLGALDRPVTPGRKPRHEPMSLTCAAPADRTLPTIVYCHKRPLIRAHDGFGFHSSIASKLNSCIGTFHGNDAIQSRMCENPNSCIFCSSRIFLASCVSAVFDSTL